VGATPYLLDTPALERRLQDLLNLQPEFGWKIAYFQNLVEARNRMHQRTVFAPASQYDVILGREIYINWESTLNFNQENDLMEHIFVL
jgi:hypothetical protein